MAPHKLSNVIVVALIVSGLCGRESPTQIVAEPKADDSQLSESVRDMIKLHKRIDGRWHYHEAWLNEGEITEHWGIAGERGITRDHKIPSGQKESEAVIAVLQPAYKDGYQEVSLDDHSMLLIEFAIDGFGTKEDIEKRHHLQDRMAETLGWTGLGHCDGGSIGSGTMEVACFVIDFETAKPIIEQDLKDTEFENFSRIYDERDSEN